MTDTIEPTSMADAEERRRLLTLDIQSIQAQLGDRQKKNDKGVRLSPEEYWKWKPTAQHAMNKMLAELRYLKLWIKENRTPRTMTGEAIGHVKGLSMMIDSMVENDGLELDDESEKPIVDAAKNFLSRIST